MMGNHIEQVKRFSEWKADEIVYLDISRDDSYGLDGNKNIIGSSSSNSEVVQNSKKNIIDIISDLSRICRVPLSVGGKIRTLEDIKKRLSGWQLGSFNESYKYKINNGMSLFRKNIIKE